MYPLIIPFPFAALEASAIVRVVGSSLERFEKDGYEVLKHDVFFGGNTASDPFMYMFVYMYIFTILYTHIVCFVIDNHM